MVYVIASKIAESDVLNVTKGNIDELIVIDNEEGNDSPESIESSESTTSPDRINKNIIYYGAPGTGKSYDVDKIIKEEYPQYDTPNNSDSKFVYRTTIYPEYSYYDFVGQTMPKTNDGDVSYAFKPGIFTRALSAAINTDRNIYLVIEEMSRGNIASIFGDIFQLLDRDESGKSSYSITNENIAREIKRFELEDKEWSSLDAAAIEAELRQEDFSNYQIKLPSNLIIYGTVNTSDQNVFVLDTAFKRRFNFKYLSVDPIKDKTNTYYINDFHFELDASNNQVSWISFYQALNKFIQQELSLPEDKLIGQFFIEGKLDNTQEDITYNTDLIGDKLLQYLWDDIEKVTNIAGSHSSLFSLEDADKRFSKAYNKFNDNKVIFDNKIYSYIEEFSENAESEIENENSSLSEVTVIEDESVINDDNSEV